MIRKLFFSLVVGLANLAHAEQKVIKLGIASNFSEASTSSSNPYGNYFRGGIELALQESEALLLKNKMKIELVEFDYGSSQHKVYNAANAACKSDVIGLIGYVYSSHSLIAAPIHQKCKLPFITPSASANRLGEFEDYVFQGTFDNSFQGEVLADVAAKKLNAKKAITISALNCAYCQDLAESFKKEFKKITGNEVQGFSVLEEDTDFSKLISELSRNKFDVVLVPNHELSSARIISALQKAGYSQPVLGGDGWGNVGEQFFGVLKTKKFEGYSLSHWMPNLPSKKSSKFARDYKNKFGKTPNDTAVLSYDSTLLFIKALLEADNVNREGINESLKKIKTFEGVTGSFIFQKNRAPQKSVVLLKNAGNKFEFLEMIHPKSSERNNP